MKCGHLNPSPRQKQLVAAQVLRLQSLSPQRHTNGTGPANESPAGSAHALTDDEKTDQESGKLDADERGD